MSTLTYLHLFVLTHPKIRTDTLYLFASFQPIALDPYQTWRGNRWMAQTLPGFTLVVRPVMVWLVPVIKMGRRWNFRWFPQVQRWRGQILVHYSYSIYCAALLRVGLCCFPYIFSTEMAAKHSRIAKPVLPQREQQQSIAASAMKTGCAENRGTKFIRCLKTRMRCIGKQCNCATQTLMWSLPENPALGNVALN